MITKEQILQWVGNPQMVDSADKADIKQLIGIYPYCEILYWCYLRLLYVSGDMTFDSELLAYGIYISDKKRFYEFLTYKPEESQPEVVAVETIAPPSDYFSFVESESDNKETLQALAEKLRQARLARIDSMQTSTSNATLPSPQKCKSSVDTSKSAENESVRRLPDVEVTEENACRMIRDKKYLTALEILRALNLNNPKKSAYFALQIKYVETIINNNNKKE